MFLAVSSTSSGQAALVVQDRVGAAAAVTVVADLRLAGIYRIHCLGLLGMEQSAV